MTTPFLVLGLLASAHQDPQVGTWNLFEDRYEALAKTLVTRNADAFMGYMTPKVTWDLGQSKPIRFEQIRAFIASFLAGLPEGPLGYGIQSIGLKGNAVQVEVTFYRGEGSAQPQVTGRWFDTWELTKEGWRIRHRELLLSGPKR